MENVFSVQFLTWNKSLKEFLLAILFCAAVFILPFYLFIYPVKDYPGEIQTAYYILVIPNWVVKAFGIGFYILIGVFFLEKIFLKKIDGELIFKENQILFNSAKRQFEINLKFIKSIFFVPKINIFTKAEKYRLTIIDKNQKKLNFKLKKEDEFERLFQVLSLFQDKINIKAEPDDMMSIFDENE